MTTAANLCKDALKNVINNNPRFTKPALVKQTHASLITRGTQDPTYWTQLIKHYLSLGSPREALLIYTRNLPSRTHQFIIPLVVKACASLPFLPVGRSLHAESIKVALLHALLVGTTVISMYSKCHRLSDARRIFDEMPYRNVITYNAMLGRYCRNGDMEPAFVLFEQAQVKTSVTYAVVIEGFARLGDTAADRRFFDRTPPKMRNVVTCVNTGNQN